MKRLLYLILLFYFPFCLLSCKDKCKRVEEGTSHAIEAYLVSGNKGGFKANGFSKYKILENDSILNIGQVDNGKSSQAEFLPLVHLYDQSTYIFIGDSVAPETLVVGNYNARLVYTTECKYSLKIDQPKIQKCSFDTCFVESFDEESQNLKIIIRN